jgi:hypothetical protein
MTILAARAWLVMPWLAGAAIATASAVAAPARLPAACAAALSQRLPGWSPWQAPPEAAAWARAQAFDPVVARGDFDANRAADWATLVAAAGEQHLVFCLNPSSPKLKLVVVSTPYCTDLVYTTRAGTRRFNFETYRHERLARDGASVSCFEKAGATYVLEKSRVRRIIDSD